MFDDVAPRYDLTNDVLSLGQDRRWRRLVLAPSTRRRASGCSTSRRAPAPRASRSANAAPSWCRATSPSACCGWASSTSRTCRSRPATPPGCRSPTTPSTPSPSPSACATSSTRTPGCARCCASPGRAGDWWSASSAHRPGRRSARVYIEYLMRALPPLARAVSSSPDAYVYLAESIRAWPDQAALAARMRQRRLVSRGVAQPLRRHRRPPPRHRPGNRWLRAARLNQPSALASAGDLVDAEDVAVRVEEPGGLLALELGDVVDGPHLGGVVVLEADARRPRAP